MPLCKSSYYFNPLSSERATPSSNNYLKQPSNETTDAVCKSATIRWTFVVWGGLHGLFLAAEKMIQDFNKKPVTVLAHKQPATVHGVSARQLSKAFSSSKLMQALLTFLLVNVTWVFFRSPDFTTAWSLLTLMFNDVKGGAELLTTLSVIKISVIISLMLACHWLMRNTKALPLTTKIRWCALGLLWSVMIILLILSRESTNSFIYFQF